MLPSVAEVYLLAVLNALQRRAGSLKHLASPVTLLLPTYDPRNVFWPSYAVRDEVEVAAEVEGSSQAEGSSQDSDSDVEEAMSVTSEATALGVVGAWIDCVDQCLSQRRVCLSDTQKGGDPSNQHDWLCA